MKPLVPQQRPQSRLQVRGTPPRSQMHAITFPCIRIGTAATMSPSPSTTSATPLMVPAEAGVVVRAKMARRQVRSIPCR